MRVLAIDTSNNVMGIAVLDGNRVAGELVTNVKKNHSVRLMPAIQQILQETGIQAKELDKVVVANGPGSYTGVRIGVTVAKTLAWTLQIPLVGVSSLEALAYNGKYYSGSVAPIFDARRGQVYMGLYEWKEGQLVAVMEDKMVILADWLKSQSGTDSNFLFLGNDVLLHQDTIEGALGDRASFAHIPQYNPRPSELAFAGLEKEPVDVHTFVPNYLRLAEAEANWLKAQGNKGT